MSEWIKHDGKGIPVPMTTLVLCRFRDGDCEEAKGFPPTPASFWHNNVNPRQSNWDHTDITGADIVAYKVVS